ncbi:MAG TPA: hypothetical protein VF962_01425 [Gemmatimonadaceae bacterium]
MVVGHRVRIVLLLPALLSGPASLLKQTAPLRHVTIVATDYAYRVPASVPPGMTAFRFVNRGTHLHELQLFRFRPDVTAQRARAYLAAGTVPDSAADASGSVLIAFPGVTAHEEVLVSLVAGERYALMCEFRDAPTKPKHTALGMVALLEVRP